MKQFVILLISTLLLVSCSSEKEEPIVPEPEPETPVLTSLSFSCYDNPLQLTTDVKGEIIGDSIVDCWVPNIMSDKELIPQVEYVGESISFDDVPATIGSTKYDFKKPVKMTIFNGYISKDYIIYVHSYTGLPVMWIETKDREEITSKERYLRASFKLVDNARTRAAGDIVEDSMYIKGRGNSTWNEFPKKPYRIKLDKKTSLLGEIKDKSWVLLSNYADKTMLRIKTAFYMGSISSLDYTPKTHFVELMLNGRYHGTYLLSEKISNSAHRVNIGDDGFLLEIDFWERVKSEEDARYFSVKSVFNPFNIKEPEVEYDDDNFLYAKSFLSLADSILYTENFRNLESGWQKYFDIDSFVDWYLINEITKNYDAKFYSSCYMHFRRNEKIKMGPLWDFDISLGNAISEFDECGKFAGFHITQAPWFSRLFEDPAFVAKVKERFNYFYSKRDDIMREINANANYLKYAVQENENRWHTFYTYTWPNYDIWGGV